MKADALDQFRRKLAANKPLFGIWVTLESASVTEMAVASGLDWVVIDAEHGHLDWQDIVQHIRATVRSKTVALVRIAEHNSSLVKRVLDIGADGVVVPWVESAQQLTELLKMAQYPPAGIRGIGGERATAWGQALAEHVAESDSRVLRSEERGGGKHCGLVTTSLDDMDQRLAAGFQVLAAGMDSSLLLSRLQQILTHVGRQQDLHPNLSPDPSD